MANITVLSEHAMERSTYLIPVAFTDEDGAAVTPTAAIWSLVKANGDVINGREDVALTPATSVGILLYGADLAILDGQGYEARSVVVRYTYDSTLGDSIPGKQEIVFTVEALAFSGFLETLSYEEAIRQIVGDANITALWMLDEASGSAAVDSVNGLDGIYSNCALANAATPWGGVAPLFDGTSSFVNIYSAALNAAFDGDEHSLMIWAKVANVGVWTDGILRYRMRFAAPGVNFSFMSKPSTFNLLESRRAGGGVVEIVEEVGVATIDWFCAGQTVSKSAGTSGEFKAYRNGSQVGATQTSLGDYVGNLSIAVIGGTSIPSLIWNGWLAGAMVTSSILTPAQMAWLYAIGAGWNV